MLYLVTPAYSLFTLALQQEVAAKAAFTLVPNTVVLTVHTQRIILRRALRYPVDDLNGTRNRVTATVRKRRGDDEKGRDTADLLPRDLVDGLLSNPVPT